MTPPTKADREALRVLLERATAAAGAHLYRGVDLRDLLPVFDALDAAEEEAARFKDDHQHACELVARMHAAAVGEVRGPIAGVVEDVAALREERDRLREALVGLQESICARRSLDTISGGTADILLGIIESALRGPTGGGDGGGK